MSDHEPGWIAGAPDRPDRRTEYPPGVLLEMKDGTLVLVGHMNTNGGQCNCCSAFDRDDVAWHRVVWSEGLGG